MLMKRSVTALFIVLALTVSSITLNPVYADEPPTISVEPSTLQLTSDQIGETVQIDIVVTNVNNLWCWNINTLRFNSAVLNLTHVEEGSFLNSYGETLFLWTEQAPEIQEGTIPELSCLLLSTNSVNGSGTILTLSFEVVGLGESQITFTQAILMEIIINEGVESYNEIDFVTKNGSITVDTYSPVVSSTPSSSVSGSPDESSVSDLTLAYAGAVVVIVLVLAVVFWLDKKPNRLGAHFWRSG
ncbi:MAG: cohesin domain-containing protein [Candidatus Bathyarchaeota archaeon]|nr:cohesin domain-containing protein [Candidatus Bathyarchaeota archaeon]